jgi:hypothetical protein
MTRLPLFAVLVALIIAAQHMASAADQIVPLRNVTSNLFVDVIGANQNDGAEVILFDFNGNKNKMFEMRTGKECEINCSSFTLLGPFLIAQHSFKCLGVKDASLHEGALIIQTTCRDRDQSQIWNFEEVGRPTVDCPHGCLPVGFRIRNRFSGQCINAGNSNFPTPPPRNAILQQITCVRDTGDRNFVNQVFDFTLPGAGPVVK